MAYDVPGFRRSYEAGADLSTKQYMFVKMSGATVVAGAAFTDLYIGVLENKPSAAGAPATVMISGVAKVKVATGVSVTAGQKLWVTATGEVTNVDPGASSSVVGTAEAGTATAGGIIPVLLKPLAAVK